MVVFLVNHTKDSSSFRIIAEKCVKTINDFTHGKDFQDFHEDDVYITCNGKIISKSDAVQDGCVYHMLPRLPGGKGGFGSMLRAIGAQIDKTNNREACRDLSGRRMRDVNNEKQLKEWLAKKAEKDKEKEEKRRERMERRRAMPNHKFDDPEYEKQKVQVAENLQDAFNTGLMRVQSKQKPSCTVTSETAGPSSTFVTASCSSGNGKKRKGESTAGPSVKVKKQTEWLGIDVDSLSDLESDEDNDDMTAAAIAVVNSDTSENSCDSKSSSEEASSSGDVCVQDSGSSEDSKEDVKHIVDNFTNDQNLDSCCSTNSEGFTVSDKKECGDTEIEVGNWKQGAEISTKINTHMPTDDDNLEKVPNNNIPPSTSSDIVSNTEENVPFSLDNYSNAEELEGLGLDKLKMILMDKGMKCGGTLQQRSERLFSVKGLSADLIPASLLAKPQNGKGNKKK